MCFTSFIGITICDNNECVARQGAQNADENCTIVARDPSASPSVAAVSRWPGTALFERIAPCLRFHQNPYADARTSTIASGR